MKVAICDDEKGVREWLRDKVLKHYPTAETTLYDNGVKLLEEEIQPDILLLDIQMPDKNGMETAKELRKHWKNTILIFVTAIEEYVFQAFDVGAFHYLVKPCTDAKFETVLQNAVEQYQESIPNREEDIIEKHVMIHARGIHTKVFAHEIIYAEVFNRKIIIHKMDGEIEYYGKLTDLEKQLGEDFFRPHRAYLVHFKYILRYDASTIYLEKGSVLMAKQNYSEFVKRYLKYNQQKGRSLRK